MTRASAALAMLHVLWTTGMAEGTTLTVIQTASTNRQETRLSMERAGGVTLHASTGEAKKLAVSAKEQRSLWKAAEGAGPLAAVPVSHCMKSASFGSSLFVEMDGDRSGDLSCPNQADPRAAALRAAAEKLLKAVASKGVTE